MNIQHHASFQEKQQIYYTFPLQRFLNYIHYIFAHTNTDVIIFSLYIPPVTLCCEIYD